MWNKKETSQLDAMLTRVPFNLTFDLETVTGVVGIPRYKTQPLCDPEAEDTVADGVT